MDATTHLIVKHNRPQYYEIYKYKEVIGISLLFMTIDALGGVFNDLSLAFKGDFDVIAGVTYSLVVVLRTSYPMYRFFFDRPWV